MRDELREYLTKADQIDEEEPHEEIEDLVETAQRAGPPPGLRRTLSRAFHILRYYKKSQLARRALSTITPGMIANRRFRVRIDEPLKIRPGAVERLRQIAEARVVHYDGCFKELERDVASGAFTLLNARRKLGAPIDWTCGASPRPSHLWRFHLQYHEYLLDLAAGLTHDDEGADIAESVDPWPTIWGTVASWIDGNPLTSANRDSDAWHPYCISRRLPVWAQLYALQTPPGELHEGMIHSFATQAEVLAGRLEFDLGGNHLLENLRALALAGAIVDGPRALRWLDIAERQLRAQLPKQILPHGEHYELAPMYHCQILGNLLQAAIAAHAVRPALAEYCRQIARPMLTWLGAVVHPDGEIPLWGDSCFGEAHGACEIARLAEIADLSCEGDTEAVGTAGQSMVAGQTWVWRCGGDALLFDCGAAAATSLPAHGHCDLLGFDASVEGRRWFVDSGLFDYEAGKMRTYCRASVAHNVTTVDDQNCCDAWPPFRMGRRGRVDRFAHGRQGRWAWCEASHDGYRTLGVPRMTRLMAAHPGSVLACVEHARSGTRRRLTGRLHLAAGVNMRRTDAEDFTLSCEGVRRRLTFSHGVAVSFARGWYCSRFGKRERTTVVEYEVSAPGDKSPCTFGWVMTHEAAGGGLDVVANGDGARVRIKAGADDEAFDWKASGG